MKVFISWSGGLSQKIAEELKRWLQHCIQSLEVFYSAEDIEKGDTWSSKISEELSDTNFGIVCLTQENVNAPWIHFEAGAISKMLDSKVATLTIDVNFSEVKGPLTKFQVTKFEKDDMLKLLQSINSSMDIPLKDQVLNDSFEAFWNKFYENVSEIINADSSKNKKKSVKFNSNEVLEEILQLVRNQNIIINSLSNINNDDVYNYSLKRKKVLDEDIDYIMHELYMFTRFIVNAQMSNQKINDEYFMEEYTRLIENLVRDNTKWNKRFSGIIGKLKYIINENIV